MPIGLRWRSSSVFICSTVAVGMFTDLFLYALLGEQVEEVLSSLTDRN